MISVVLLAGAVCFLVFGLLRTQRTAARFSSGSWEELVARLSPLDSEGITAIALEYLHPTKSQLGMEPSEMWTVIGGTEGLARMRANADILLALANYAQRWNFHEGVIVAERMRHDGLALKRASTRITLGLTWGIGMARGAFYVHEAASSYYLMRQRLLALYETSHAGRYPMLAQAL